MLFTSHLTATSWLLWTDFWSHSTSHEWWDQYFPAKTKVVYRSLKFRHYFNTQRYIVVSSSCFCSCTWISRDLTNMWKFIIIAKLYVLRIRQRIGNNTHNALHVTVYIFKKLDLCHIFKQVNQRRYERRCSPKPKLHFKKTKKQNMAKNDFQYGRWNSYTLQCK